jgi:hypothetical protein
LLHGVLTFLVVGRVAPPGCLLVVLYGFIVYPDGYIFKAEYSTNIQRDIYAMWTKSTKPEAIMKLYFEYFPEIMKIQTETPAQKAAQQKYMEKFAVARVRMETEKSEAVKTHAAALGESVNAFINRAIDETIERDNAKARE